MIGHSHMTSNFQFFIWGWFGFGASGKLENGLVKSSFRGELLDYYVQCTTVRRVVGTLVPVMSNIYVVSIISEHRFKTDRYLKQYQIIMMSHSSR